MAARLMSYNIQLTDLAAQHQPGQLQLLASLVVNEQKMARHTHAVGFQAKQSNSLKESESIPTISISHGRLLYAAFSASISSLYFFINSVC